MDRRTEVLLAASLSAAVAILVLVLYVPDALGVATFPTLLLITTLLRLSLNVSSSQLILLQADAGEVIRAFGVFVVRGNYVVGAVIFLVLIIVQFVVIARDGEPVAEVGARFVPDAMPGKQMAIDAEQRAGAIDGNEARRRRRQLARESQFYGAMDGAMKFVKGEVCFSLMVGAMKPAENARKRTAVVYCLTSTTRQKEADTIEAQRAAARRIIERHDLELIPSGPEMTGWWQDNGVSGRLLEVRCLQDLLAEMRSGALRPDYLVVYSLSRLSRIDVLTKDVEKAVQSAKDGAEIAPVLRSVGCQIIDADGVIDPATMAYDFKLLFAAED